MGWATNLSSGAAALIIDSKPTAPGNAENVGCFTTTNEGQVLHVGNREYSGNRRSKIRQHDFVYQSSHAIGMPLHQAIAPNTNTITIASAKIVCAIATYLPVTLT